MTTSKGNFFTAHYDWIAAIVGVLALAAAGAFFAMSLGNDPESAAAACEQRLASLKPAHEGVDQADMTMFRLTLQTLKAPLAMPEIDAKRPSFLASERRLFCQKGDEESKKEACGKPIPAGSETCPFCGMKQNVVKVEVDSDGDGLPNAWEKKYGLNEGDPSDAAKDSDGDGFSNLEEFQAKTDPKDPESHPDYLDFLSIAGDLKRDMLPFWFKMYNPIRGGHRVTFAVPNGAYKNTTSAVIGEEIVFQLAKPKYVRGRLQDDRVKSGWKLAGFKSQTKMVTKPGSDQKIPMDVSTVDLERVSDGRKLTARIGVQSVPIEEQVDLSWSRGEGKTITASTGLEFTLGNRKYRVKKIAKTAKGLSVTITDLKSNKEKIL